MGTPATSTTMLDAAMDEWLWPASCPEMRQMESALRCLICGDFFHGPVMLPCTHTFCSECVRRFLQSRSNHGWCPECKQPCTPSELVPNRSLEKIVLLFQQMKPTVLPILEKATKLLDAAKSTTPTKQGKTNGDGKPPERMALLSYSVMKEKDIKKLLEGIGIRAQIKNREEIIQIHKEYVLLSNAQADSSHPKSAKQIRDEVMRNYRARQAEKTASSSARKSLDATQAPVVTAEMRAGFERLRQQVKARKNQLQTKQEEANGNNASTPARDNADDTDEVDDEEDGDGDGGGLWRHVHAVKSDQEFYIHSITKEIRSEPPREFLDYQQRLQERRDQAHNDNDDEEPVVVVGTHTPPSSQVEMSGPVKADDDDDFEILRTTPPPKPPLGNPNPTSRSVSESARKKAERRRSSMGSSSASSSAAASFFSQETSCSTQETSTQHAPSASTSASLSLSLSAEPSSSLSVHSVDDDNDNANADDLSPETRWDCPRCTLVNETAGSLAECEACGYQHRPARKKQKLQFQSKIFPSS